MANVDIDVEGICKAMYSVAVPVRRADGTSEVKGIFKVGVFPLTSGKLSPFYVDTRVIPSSPGEYSFIVGELLDRVEGFLNEGITYIVSSESAGIPWGVPTAYMLNTPFGFVRKDRDEFAGALEEGARVLGVDDLNTTLKTVGHILNVVRKEGGTIDDVIVVIDRKEYNKEALEKLKVNLHSLVTINDLVDYGVSNGHISEEQLALVETYWKDPIGFAIDAINSNGKLLVNHPRWGRVKQFYSGNPKVLEAIAEAEKKYRS
ncbi:MAG: hypothetical protein J7K73_00295 [Nanoarchaeota archaeon]|nr:hypothetical protein [Nanoarchaeota archaeon]